MGVLVLFLHDVADVFLEFSKCMVYTKYRGDKHHALNNHLATGGFLCFTAVWYALSSVCTCALVTAGIIVACTVHSPGYT